MVRLEFCYKQLKTSFSMGTGKCYLVKDDDWTLITFRFFPLGEGHIWAQLKKNWNWHHQTLESLITVLTTIQLLIWMWFFSCKCHCCNVAQCQTSGTIQLIWRTESKMYDNEGFWNLSTELTLTFIFEFYFLCSSTGVRASPVKLSQSRGIL